MSDIVERLHLLQSGAAWVCGETAATLEDAADEIERLLAERDRLREVVRKVRDELGGSGQTHASLLCAFNIAYAALKEPGHD
jgi:hypothetical protein